MNKKILFLFTLIINNCFANISFDFDSVFNKASTEEGKKDYISTYQGTNIPETEININNIDSKSEEVLNNNSTGQFITETKNDYNTQQLGNIVDNTDYNINNSVDIVNKDYCDPYNDVEYKICYKYYDDNVCKDNYKKECVSLLEMVCSEYESGCTTAGLELSSLPSDLNWNYNNNILTIGKRSGANYWAGYCIIIDKTITFTISNLELVEMFSLNRAVFDDYMMISLNDEIVYVGPDGGNELEIINGYVYNGFGYTPCERSTLWNQYINKDLTSLLKVGTNKLRMKVIVSGTGQGSMEFVLKNRCCKEHAEKWTEKCDIDNNDKCKLYSRICTKKDHTIIFDGKSIFKKCAEYNQIYNCQNSSCFLNENDCDNMDITNCSLKDSIFIDKDTEKFTYKCLISRTTPKDCNQNIKCLDGNCYELEETQDNIQDMLNAISILASLNESTNTIDPDNLTMLNGENIKCRKSTGAVAGFKDCCGDENWGNSLSGCSEEEERLKEKRENSDCVYIGNYCNKKIDVGFNEICTEKKYSYCCFNNKFSKILANATRQQGLQTWGNPENTNCSGILINQLEKVDFTKIDFSELYDDIKSSINKSDIEEQIQQSLDRLKNGIK